MFPVDEQTLVLLAGVTLAMISAFVLVWRVAARRQTEEADAVQREIREVAVPERTRKAQMSVVQQPAAAASVVTPVVRREPPKATAAPSTGLSYTAIAVAAAEAARHAKAEAAHAGVTAAMKSSSADDPFGVMAELPAGASYTAIAVAHAEAAARAKAALASQSRI